MVDLSGKPVRMLDVDDRNRLLLWGIPVAIRENIRILDKHKRQPVNKSFVAFVYFPHASHVRIRSRHKWVGDTLNLQTLKLLYLQFREDFPGIHPSRVYVGWYAYKQLMGWYRKLGGDKDERPHRFIHRGLQQQRSARWLKEKARRRDESWTAFNNDWRAKTLGRVPLSIHGPGEV